MPKKQALKSSSISDILGRTHLKEVAVKTPTNCVVCLKAIPAARLEALTTLKTPFSRWTHVTCSNVPKVKGIYMGEVGTSEIKLCDKIYDDSVRGVFRKAEVDTGDVVEGGDN